MLWNEVHPVRAILAGVVIAASVAMVFLKIEIPGEWWVIAGAVGVHYFDGR